MSFEEMESIIRDDDFHAMTWKMDGKECWMAGWWIIAIGDDEREYDTKEEMLEAELPNLRERFKDMEDIDITSF